MCGKAHQKELNGRFCMDFSTGFAQAVFAVLSEHKPRTLRGGGGGPRHLL